MPPHMKWSLYSFARSQQSPSPEDSEPSPFLDDKFIGVQPMTASNWLQEFSLLPPQGCMPLGSFNELNSILLCSAFPHTLTHENGKKINGWRENKWRRWYWVHKHWGHDNLLVACFAASGKCWLCCWLKMNLDWPWKCWFKVCQFYHVLSTSEVRKLWYITFASHKACDPPRASTAWEWSYKMKERGQGDLVSNCESYSTLP